MNRLLGLILLGVVLFAAASTPGAQVTPGESRRVVEIENLGGTVIHDDRIPGKPIIAVSLKGTQVTDAELAHLKAFSQLQSLDLGDTKVIDTGLEHLKGLIHLRSLYLYCTPVTDAGLAHLKDLSQLQLLDLSGTSVTDAGLEHLKPFAQL